MMIAVYNKDSGQINYITQCPDRSVDAQYDPTVDGYVEIVSATEIHNKYIVNGVLTDRPVMTPTVTDLTITGLPIPCSLTTYGTTYEVTDGEVVLNYDLAGEYLVQVKAFPYLDWEVTVDAN